MALNLFSARNSFVYGDARAVLERVVIFVGGQAEESFGEFVVERYKFGYSGVEVKFFHLNFNVIPKAFQCLFGERLKD